MLAKVHNRGWAVFVKVSLDDDHKLGSGIVSTYEGCRFVHPCDVLWTVVSTATRQHVSAGKQPQ